MSTKILGIEFAPLLLPLERRLQTFSVAFWISMFLFFGPVFSIFLVYLLVFTSYWWLPLLYCTWIYLDSDTCQRGGRSGWSVRFVRGWRIWRFYCNYFPIKLVKTCELDAGRNYLVGSHPHGVLCSGAFGCFATEGANFAQIFPGLTPRLLSLDFQFLIPGYREMFSSGGACSASRRSLGTLLSTPGGGVFSVLVVGGAGESLNSDPTKIKLILKERKGFIRLALQHGADLLPSFSFGEAFIYSQIPNPEGSFIRGAQEFIRKFIGFAPVLFHARGLFQYNFGILPHRKPITLVVGKPIPVTKLQDPGEEDIAELQDKYIEALRLLYDQYNPVYGDQNIQLVI